MKKTIALCMAVFMVFGALLLSPIAAFAEPEESPSPSPSPSPSASASPAPVENVNLSIEKYSPTSMTSGGDVTVRIVIKNNGTAIDGASLSIGGSNVATYGTIGAGESKTYDGTYSLSTANLDKNVEVLLKYTFSGAAKTKSSSFKVSKKDANVGVSTSVSVDQSTVASGTKVKFSFSVENTGDVKIENAVIKDPELNGGSALNSAFSLSPGKSTVVTYTATITETTSISPTLSYKADGETRTKSMGNATVTVSEASVSVVAVADNMEPASGEKVNFTITITNSGGVSLSNLKLQDVLGGNVVISGTTLAAGASMSATHTVSFTENAEYSFTLTGVSDDGKAHSFDSNSVGITLKEEDASELYKNILSLIVTADLKNYKKTGEVEFTITLKNTGTVTFTGVTISEEKLGVLDTNIATFGPGEEQKKAVAKIENDGTYVFEAQMLDPNGNVVIVTSNQVEVKEEQKAGSGIQTLLWVIGIIVVLMIAAGVTLVVLKSKEKKEREAMEAQKGARISRRNPQNRGQVNSDRSAQAVSERAQRPRPTTYEEMDSEPEEEASYDDYYPKNNNAPVEEEEPAYDNYENYQNNNEYAPEEEEPPAQEPAPPAKKVRRRPDITDRNSF